MSKHQVDTGELRDAIHQVITENNKAVQDYKNGKTQSIMFLMGHVKRKFPQSDSEQILEALKEALS